MNQSVHNEATQRELWVSRSWSIGFGEIGWEFWWIGGEPSEQQFFVGKIVDHGLPLTCHGWLGQLADCFGWDEIRLIEMASCDGLDIGRLESSSDRDVAYRTLVGIARVVFD